MENQTQKETKDKKQIIVSVVVILVVVALFYFLLSFDFNKPTEEEKQRLTPEQRGAILEEALLNTEVSSSEERLRVLNENRINNPSSPEERMQILENNL